MTPFPPPPPSPPPSAADILNMMRRAAAAASTTDDVVRIARIISSLERNMNATTRNVQAATRHATSNRGFENRLMSFDIQRRAITIILGLVNDLDNLQKKALKNGLSLQHAFEAAIPTLAEIPGGLRSNLLEAFEYFEVGLKRPTENMIKLSAHLRSVGGNSEKLRTTLVDLQTAAGTNIDKLSETILNSTKTYQITSDNIIKAIGGLSERFFEFNTLNIGDQVTEAVTMMSQLGPQFSSHINNVLKALTQTGVDGAANVARLGLLSERSMVMNAKTARDVVEAVRSSVTKVSSMTRQMLSGGDPLIGLGSTYSIFGEDMVKSTNILSKKINELTIVASDQLQQFKEFGDVLSNFGSQLLDPLVYGFKKIIPFITSMANNPLVKATAQIAAVGAAISLSVTAMRTVFGLLARFIRPFGPIGTVLSIFLAGFMRLSSESKDIAKESLDLQKKQDAREQSMSNFAMELADKSARISEEIKHIVEESREKEVMRRLADIMERVDKKLENIQQSSRETVNLTGAKPIRGAK